MNNKLSAFLYGTFGVFLCFGALFGILGLDRQEICFGLILFALSGIMYDLIEIKNK